MLDSRAAVAAERQGKNALNSWTLWQSNQSSLECDVMRQHNGAEQQRTLSDKLRSKQRNIVWPDTLINGRSVDAFLWKGSAYSATVFGGINRQSARIRVLPVNTGKRNEVAWATYRRQLRFNRLLRLRSHANYG